MRPRDRGQAQGSLVYCAYLYSILASTWAETQWPCALLSALCPTPSCFSSVVLSTLVSQIVLEREKATRNGITHAQWNYAAPLEIHLSNSTRRGAERGEARRGERTAIGRPRFSQFVDERTRVPLCLHKQCICIETIGRTKGTVNLLIPPATDNAIPPPPRTIYRSSCGPPSCFELARCRTGRRKYTCTRVPRSTDDRRGRKNASLKRTRFFRDSFSKDYDRLSLSLARARFKDRGDY